VLGVEMASTGEVACFGRNKYEAFLKSYLSVPSNFKMPQHQVVILSGSLPKELLSSIKDLQDMGFKVRRLRHFSYLFS
jgi:carbamoyl-phosphate synthase/aspartate carbamoyltransferase